MNSPVNTFEEIARKQGVVLQRKAEKLCKGLIRRYRPNIPLRKRFCLYNRMVCSVANIRSLSISKSRRVYVG